MQTLHINTLQHANISTQKQVYILLHPITCTKPNNQMYAALLYKVLVLPL